MTNEENHVRLIAPPARAGAGLRRQNKRCTAADAIGPKLAGGARRLRTEADGLEPRIRSGTTILRCRQGGTSG
jgi:hypothetical protein